MKNFNLLIIYLILSEDVIAQFNNPKPICKQANKEVEHKISKEFTPVHSVEFKDLPGLSNDYRLEACKRVHSISSLFKYNLKNNINSKVSNSFYANIITNPINIIINTTKLLNQTGNVDYNPKIILKKNNGQQKVISSNVENIQDLNYFISQCEPFRGYIKQFTSQSAAARQLEDKGKDVFKNPIINVFDDLGVNIIPRIGPNYLIREKLYSLGFNLSNTQFMRNDSSINYSRKPEMCEKDEIPSEDCSYNSKEKEFLYNWAKRIDSFHCYTAKEPFVNTVFRISGCGIYNYDEIEIKVGNESKTIKVFDLIRNSLVFNDEPLKNGERHVSVKINGSSLNDCSISKINDYLDKLDTKVELLPIFHGPQFSPFIINDSETSVIGSIPISIGNGRKTCGIFTIIPHKVEYLTYGDIANVWTRKVVYGSKYKTTTESSIPPNSFRVKFSITLQGEQPIVIEKEVSLPPKFAIGICGDSYASGEGAPFDKCNESVPWINTNNDWLPSGMDYTHRSHYSGHFRGVNELVKLRQDLAFEVHFFASSGAAIYTDDYGPPSWMDNEKEKNAALYDKENDIHGQFNKIKTLINGRKADLLLLSIGGNDSGFGNVITNSFAGNDKEFVKVGHYEKFTSNSRNSSHNDRIFHPQYSCNNWCSYPPALSNCFECDIIAGGSGRVFERNKWFNWDMGSNLKALSKIYDDHLNWQLYGKDMLITNYPNPLKKSDGTPYAKMGRNDNYYPNTSNNVSCSQGIELPASGDPGLKDLERFEKFEERMSAEEIEYLSNSFHSELNQIIKDKFKSRVIDVELNPETRMWGHGINAPNESRWINTAMDGGTCDQCVIGCNTALIDKRIGIPLPGGSGDFSGNDNCLQCSMHPNKKGYEMVYSKPIFERLKTYFKDELKLGLSNL